jgi:hypothetical protein
LAKEEAAEESPARCYGGRREGQSQRPSVIPLACKLNSLLERRQRSGKMFFRKLNALDTKHFASL